jgi:hypothetical protein
LSLLSYGVFTLGVVLGGMVLLVIFSLLAVAQKGDAYLDQLECILLQGQANAPSSVKEKKSDNLCLEQCKVQCSRFKVQG